MLGMLPMVWVAEAVSGIDTASTAPSRTSCAMMRVSVRGWLIDVIAFAIAQGNAGAFAFDFERLQAGLQRVAGVVAEFVAGGPVVCGGQKSGCEAVIIAGVKAVTGAFGDHLQRVHIADRGTKVGKHRRSQIFRLSRFHHDVRVAENAHRLVDILEKDGDGAALLSTIGTGGVPGGGGRRGGLSGNPVLTQIRTFWPEIPARCLATA